MSYPGRKIFERFTERARQVIVLAQEEARLLKHNYIGTEHILLGLLREEQGLAAQLLVSLGITLERARAQVIQIVGQGDEVTAGQIPFTPRAKKILELTLRESLGLGHNHIATHHILLGLLRETEGVADRVLRDLGADAKDLRQHVLAGLDAAPDENPPRRTEQTAARDPDFPSETYVLSRLTERARRAVDLAQEEARQMLHHDVGTEHILLGLLGVEDGAAARALEAFDVTIEQVRTELVRRLDTGEEVASDHLRFDRRARKVFELALREALSLGHNYIGTEHILLALVRDGQGLANVKADGDEIRNEVIRILSGPGTRSVATFGIPEPSIASIGLSDSLLDGAGPVLRALLHEIEEQTDRSADAGDLLVLLASVPEGLAARALAGLGIDPAALARAVGEVRIDGARSTLLPPAEILAERDRVRAEKQALILEKTARVAELRERERELVDQAAKLVDQRQTELLADLRTRLDLGGQ